MTKQDLKGLIASDLIIVATETKGKMPSKLNFTELIDVVTDVVKNCSIHVVVKSFTCDVCYTETINKKDEYDNIYCDDCKEL